MPHAARCRGSDMFQISVQVELVQRKSIAQVRIQAHSAMTIAQLREEVAREASCESPEDVLIMTHGGVIMASLQQCINEIPGIYETQALRATTARGNARAAPGGPLIGEQLAARDDHFDVLWRTMDRAGAEHVWNLLMALPTQESVLRDVESGNAEWSRLLDPRRRPGGLWRVLYVLMVVDGKLSDAATAEDNDWEAAFVRSGGPKAVKDLA